MTGVITVSWYPPSLADDEGNDVDSVIPLLLDAADKLQLKVYLWTLVYDFCEKFVIGYSLFFILWRNVLHWQLF